MADGNRFYHPKPSFFDEFSKGVGLGLSMRQASDRAKQIEINAQEQQMRMGELQRQRGVEDTMRTYANTVLPGTEIGGALDSQATAEAQGNQQVSQDPNLTSDISGVQGVYGPPTGGEKPTLRMIMEQGVRQGASPQMIKAIGDAIQMTQKEGTPQVMDIPGTGSKYVYGGPSGHVINPPNAGAGATLSGMRGQIIAAEAGLPSLLDTPEKLAGAKRALKESLSIPNSPDAIAYQAQLGEVQKARDRGELAPADESRPNEAIAYDWLTGRKVVRAANTAKATEEAKNAVRSTPAAAAAVTNIEEAKTAGRPLDATTQKDVTSLESIMRQVDSVNANLDPNFLGPVKGKELAFSVRRQVGSYIKSPVGEKEMVFRSSLADISDMLLRQRSGASINETEYKRLRELLPKADDELVPFKAGMKRFATELQAISESKKKLGKTPRGKLETGQPSPTMSRDEYMKKVLEQ